MAYELTCSSCQARLHLKDDTGEESLICPRCLKMVPRPASAGQVPVPAAETSAITALASRSPRSVPTVESETNQYSCLGYFLSLAVTVLAIMGLIRLLAQRHSQYQTPIVLLTLAALIVLLAGLILYPIGRSKFRTSRIASAKLGESPGQSAARHFGVILLMVSLFALALFIICFTVCTAFVIDDAYQHGSLLHSLHGGGSRRCSPVSTASKSAVPPSSVRPVVFARTVGSRGQPGSPTSPAIGSWPCDTVSPG